MIEEFSPGAASRRFVQQATFQSTRPGGLSSPFPVY